MNEIRETIDNRPDYSGWIYSKGILPDCVALSMVGLGVILLSGFLGLTQGSLVSLVCDTLQRWFGLGAFFPVAIIIITGIWIILCRMFMLRGSGKFTNVYLLFGFILFFTILSLFSRLITPYAGGVVGQAIVTGLTAAFGEYPAQGILWVLLMVSSLVVLRIPCWLPGLIRAVSAGISSVQKMQMPKISLEKPDVSLSERFTVPKINKNAQKETAAQKIRDLLDPEKPASASDETFVYAEVPLESKSSAPKAVVPTEKRAIRTNRLPPLNLLEPELGFIVDESNVRLEIQAIEEAMQEFGKPVKVVGYNIGPCITQYQVVPGSLRRENTRGELNPKSIRVSEIAQLERDLAVRMGISNLSIQAPVPGESYIGVDMPNPNAMKVRLRPLIESPEFQRKFTPLKIALGRDIRGNPVTFDLEDMPHLLVAGTTNSGKSICLRSMAVCLVMNNTPEQLRLVMIDPKRVEFSRFNGLPHLLGKVETEYERSVAVLEWAVQEMMARYQLFENTGVKKLSVYNEYAAQNKLQKLPLIVIFIDEMAEIMKSPDKLGEIAIDKLTSLARATGIHLVGATQRPDVTVITGKIKTNIPARIALSVSSATNSRVIMGKQGAEKLLGRGDMYFVNPSVNVPVRVQGPLLTNEEIDRVVALWKKLAPKSAEEEGKSPWDEMIEAEGAEEGKSGESRDEKKLKEAIKLVTRTRKASAAFIQGKIGVSFPTATRLIKRMEEIGVVGPMQSGGRAREVLWDEEDARHYGEDIGFDEE